MKAAVPWPEDVSMIVPYTAINRALNRPREPVVIDLCDVIGSRNDQPQINIHLLSISGKCKLNDFVLDI